MTSRITSLTTAGRPTPLGIDALHPQFAWRVEGADGQEACWIQVATDPGFGASCMVWDSGWIADDRPFGHSYQGAALAARTVYWWRVRVRGASADSGWGESSWFETGLLQPEDWSARWITDTEQHEATTLYFRADIDVPAGAVRARAYASGLGWYRLFVNGTDVTGDALVPRWTPFDQYVEYQTFDILDVVESGTLAVGITVSEGRFRGRLGAYSKPARFGDKLAAILQLEFAYPDGTRITVGTDATWRVGEGRVATSDPKFGERADLRIDDRQWLAPGGKTLRERQVALLPPHPRALVAEEVERVAAVRRIPGRVTRTPSGVQLIDFEQNFAGFAAVRLSGPEGATVKLSYGEVLTPDGELSTDYLHFPGIDEGSDWFQRDEVVLGCEAVEYSPRFTIHGFRYLAVEGSIDQLSGSDVVGVVMSTGLRETARFSCSDRRLEQVWRNTLWSLRSNFVDTPTDCPTRERSGWTADIQVFGPTASIMVDADGYLRRYLRNLSADQFDDGRVPPFIPAENTAFTTERAEFFDMVSTSVGWGDVAVMLPWTLHLYYGDREVLVRQYSSAKAWVEHLERRAKEHGRAREYGSSAGELEEYVVDTGFSWGEWLRPGETFASQMRDNMKGGRPEVATAYFAHSSRLLAQMARILGRHGDADRFTRLAANARGAYRAAFVGEGGSRIGVDKQDDYVRALAFELLEGDERKTAVDRLVELIDEADGHLGTGFLSTAMLLPVLCDHGRADVAFRIVLNDTPPSWLAQLGRGATTMWETWEGYDEKGNPNASHNHYALGAVAGWLHQYVAGIRPIESGYRTFLVAPFTGDLAHAEAAVETPWGEASAAWSRHATGGRIQVVVPPGTRAHVMLPGSSVQVLGPGKHLLPWGGDSAPDSSGR
ncbi:family 78 glycoside hydrolase catalytic domain [Streptomyces sp. NPDC057690]|uniref:alpha-L-rhamnosidase n=1 Tax=Streptomyces sp. NPDC057690 TaxID=3346214 RepID=UPI0036A1E138